MAPTGEASWTCMPVPMSTGSSPRNQNETYRPSSPPSLMPVEILGRRSSAWSPPNQVRGESTAMAGERQRRHRHGKGHRVEPARQVPTSRRRGELSRERWTGRPAFLFFLILLLWGSSLSIPRSATAHVTPALVHLTHTTHTPNHPAQVDTPVPQQGPPGPPGPQGPQGPAGPQG